MVMKESKIFNIAHRGARSLSPENTLIAALKGWELGSDFWELDVSITADGEMVVIHDSTLNRTSNAAAIFPNRAPWKVHKFTLAELKTLDFGSWFLETDPFGQITEGNIPLADQHLFKNVSIPTLREALEFTKEQNWQVNVELKDHTGMPGDAFVVEDAVALIKETKMEEKVLISSFNHAYLERVKKADSAIATGALVDQAVTDPVVLLEKLDAKAYHPSVSASNALHFSALRRAGKEINVWTVNDQATMTHMMTMGATGIITDFPQRLKSILNS